MQIPEAENILKRMKELDKQIQKDIEEKDKNEKDQNKDGKDKGVKE